MFWSKAKDRTHQSKIVNIKVREVLWFCSLCTSAPIDASFRVHFARSSNPIEPSVLSPAMMLCKSDIVVTHPVSATTSCSTKISDARDFLTVVVPTRNDWRCCSAALISVISDKIIRACLGAPLALRQKFIKIDETWAVAVSKPAMPAETDKGSMYAIWKIEGCTFVTRDLSSSSFDAVSSNS